MIKNDFFFEKYVVNRETQTHDLNLAIVHWS